METKTEKIDGMKKDATVEDKKTKSFKRRPKFKRNKESIPSKGENDFAFWNEYPDLMDIATSIPWMHIAGTTLTGQNVNVELPNVAVQYYYPVPGIARSSTSPLNMMFRNLYLDMHRRYRGIGTYQASDIAITVLCIESVQQLIVEAERIYGIINGYPIKSRIEPEGLLRAMGYNATFIQQLKSDLAGFRYSVNRLIRLARRLPLPAGMNFFKNHVVLNGFVYKDSEDERADLLVFQPKGYFVYQTTGDSCCIASAGTAFFTNLQRGSLTPNQLLTAIDTAINTLLNDSDVLRITSDFIACYGEENMQVLNPLPEDYTVVPVYSESILSKWHNSERPTGTYGIGYEAVNSNITQLPVNTSGSTFAIYQYGDVVYSLPTGYNPGSGSTPAWEIESTSGSYFIMNTSAEKGNMHIAHIADTWQNQPDKATVCEAMLWKNSARQATGASNHAALSITSASTELMAELQIYKVVNGSYTTPVSYYQGTNASFCNSSLLDGLAHFDWHPYLLHFNAAGTVTQIDGDTDNVTVVSDEVIGHIQDAALLSAFKVSINFVK